MTEKAMCRADFYSGMNWHNLTLEQCAEVKKLEADGFLRINDPANGFVGSAIPRQGELDLGRRE